MALAEIRQNPTCLVGFNDIRTRKVFSLVERGVGSFGIHFKQENVQICVTTVERFQDISIRPKLSVCITHRAKVQHLRTSS